MHAPRRVLRVRVRRMCLERRVAIGSQGSGFVSTPSIFIAQCRAALVASVAGTAQPYAASVAGPTISRVSGGSSTVASASARVRLLVRAGCTSLHHRSAFSRTVSARRAVASALAVAQLRAQADLPPASQLSAVSVLNHCHLGPHRVAAVRLAIRCTSPAAQGEVIADRRAALSGNGTHATRGISAALRRLRTGA
jgi:hypothetical protein